MLIVLEVGGIFGVSGFFFQAGDDIRDLVRSRGLGDVYKRQMLYTVMLSHQSHKKINNCIPGQGYEKNNAECCTCLLYTSDAADDLLCVDSGGRRIIKKKTINTNI